MKLPKKLLIRVLFALAIIPMGVPALSLATTNVGEFSYQRLSADFVAGSPASGLLTVEDQNSIFILPSQGDISRLEAPASNVHFDFGSGSIGVAAIDVSLVITGITTASATSSGTITLTDIDGDKIFADVSGDWVNVAGTADLNGVLSNVFYSSTGTFDGTTGSSSTSFAEQQPFSGNIISLVFRGWFSDGAGTAANFSDKMTHVDGQFVGETVPEPASLSLLAIGLAGVCLRRRTAV